MSKSCDIKQWTGRELYDMYRNEYKAAFNCTVDAWEELSEADRTVWVSRAEQVTKEGADEDNS